MQQYDPEWYAARAGRLTASSAGTIMSGSRDDALALKDLIKTIAFERAFGSTEGEGYQSAAMKRGKELEPRARDWYEYKTDCTDLRTVAFVGHPVLQFVSASPDALRDDRTVEIKCPYHKAWVEAKRTRKVPAEYRWQAKWQMWCTGLRRCDFVVWHPSAGGILIDDLTVTDDEIAMMEDRAWSVEADVRELFEIITRKD